MSSDHDIPVQCTRCRNKHMESERHSVPDRKFKNLTVTNQVCPRCGCRSYYNLAPYIAYCWASGLIEFGEKVPDGAIKIAHGPKANLKREIEVIARHGRGDSAGKLLVPGIPEAGDQRTAGDALQAFLDRAAKSRSAKKYSVVFTSKEA